MDLAQDLCTSQGWKLVGSTLRYNDLPMNVGLISGTDGSFTTTAKNGTQVQSFNVGYKTGGTQKPSGTMIFRQNRVVLTPVGIYLTIDKSLSQLDISWEYVAATGVEACRITRGYKKDGIAYGTDPIMGQLKDAIAFPILDTQK